MTICRTLFGGILGVGFVLFCSAFAIGAADTAPSDATVLHSGLSAEDAVKFASAPPGFKLKVFAAEPDVKQPIAFCEDDRGRLWVAEGYTYPRRAPEGQGKDRILVFEDTDGDGHFDRRTVFMEGLNLISGLEIGFGGVWVGAAPYLMFIPIADGDAPKPAGPPQILLDGFDFLRDTHETLNTFNWGPDGWLYGCHGVFCPSNPGKPGASLTERQWLDAGVWRYHPTKHKFEIFAEGTSNPWGIDFDDHGQLWEEGCVIPHLWHMIQGARYERQGGEHYCINAEEIARNGKFRNDRSHKPIYPYCYDDIKTVADHLHYLGNQWNDTDRFSSDALGGGHAHAGLMVYLGDSWPDQYRGQVFIGNIHGQRLNMDVPERRGSGFVAHHGKDFINFNDTWSQTLNQRYDQNGSVYIIDWYDKNQCHDGRPEIHDRSNGRIYKIVYNDQPWTAVDLTKKTDLELAEMQLTRNDWYDRHARRLLMERAKDHGLDAAARDALLVIARSNPDGSRKLRALWALHVTGSLTESIGLELLASADEYVRAWAIQSLAESRAPSAAVVSRLAEMAKSDSSPVVRLYIWSALQRMPLDRRWDAYAALLSRGEDADDHNIPLMAWYAGEPLAAAAPGRELALSVNSRLPRILEFSARRVASLGTADAAALVVGTLAKLDDTAKQIAILTGLTDAFRGQRSVPMPAGWDAVEAKLGQSPDADARSLALALSLTFGSPNAKNTLHKLVADTTAPSAARHAALESLLGVKDPELPGIMIGLLDDSAVRGAALRGLALYDDSKTPPAVLGVYSRLPGGEKRDALNTLASRPAFAKPLLSAIDQGAISAKDLPAEIVRELRGLRNPEVEALVQKVWGSFRDSSADKQREIQTAFDRYYGGGSHPGDASRGRAIFVKTCQQCHTLYGEGGKVGPDITGSNRGDIRYLLGNIVDPNAVVPNEYRMSTIETRDGRSITGIVKNQDDKALTIATANEMVVVPRAEVASQQQSEMSMMPEGLLTALNDQEFRDLIYYLSRPGQSPLPTATTK
jgi:putative membrane-bound dehydrogenase-like protein